MTVLKPCPFCGGKPKIKLIYGETYSVVCSCGARMTAGDYFDSCEMQEAKSVKAWNKRVILPGTNTKAEWIKKQENLDGTIIYECSNCEHEIELTASPWHYDVYYCEACGANMGLDDE